VTLQDILQNKDIHLDAILIASLVFDLLKVSCGDALVFIFPATSNQSMPGVDDDDDRGVGVEVDGAGCFGRSRLCSPDDGICICNEKRLKYRPSIYNLIAFSALTLLAGRQEGHPACKN